MNVSIVYFIYSCFPNWIAVCWLLWLVFWVQFKLSQLLFYLSFLSVSAFIFRFWCFSSIYYCFSLCGRARSRGTFFGERCKLIDNNLIIGITIRAYVARNVIYVYECVCVWVIQFCNLRVFIEMIIIIISLCVVSSLCVFLCVCGVTVWLL